MPGPLGNAVLLGVSSEVVENLLEGNGVQNAKTINADELFVGGGPGAGQGGGLGAIQFPDEISVLNSQGEVIDPATAQQFEPVSNIINRDDQNVNSSLQEPRTVSLDSKGRSRVFFYAETEGVTTDFHYDISPDGDIWINDVNPTPDAGGYTNAQEVRFEGFQSARWGRLRADGANSDDEVNMAIQFSPL